MLQNQVLITVYINYILWDKNVLLMIEIIRCHILVSFSLTTTI